MTMTNALTEEQKKLVEDNHNLIYSYIWKKGLNNNETEDWYGIFAVSLCNAAKLYDPDKGYRFTTLAFTAMENDLKMVLRHRKIQIPEECKISLDDPIDEKGHTIHEIIADNKDNFQAVFLNDAVERVLGRMNERKSRVIRCLIKNDLSATLTAKELGLSSQHVSKTYSMFLKKIKKAYVA